MEQHNSSDCLHGRFNATVSVFRLQKGKEAHPENYADSFSADLSIKCLECDCFFTFVGMVIGASPFQPMISADGIEARLPIKPTDISDRRR